MSVKVVVVVVMAAGKKWVVDSMCFGFFVSAVEVMCSGGKQAPNIVICMPSPFFLCTIYSAPFSLPPSILAISSRFPFFPFYRDKVMRMPMTAAMLLTSRRIAVSAVPSL